MNKTFCDPKKNAKVKFAWAIKFFYDNNSNILQVKECLG